MIEQVYNLVTKPGVMFRLWFRGRCRCGWVTNTAQCAQCGADPDAAAI